MKTIVYRIQIGRGFSFQDIEFLKGAGGAEWTSLEPGAFAQSSPDEGFEPSESKEMTCGPNHDTENHPSERQHSENGEDTQRDRGHNEKEGKSEPIAKGPFRPYRDFAITIRKQIIPNVWAGQTSKWSPLREKNKIPLPFYFTSSLFQCRYETS